MRLVTSVGSFLVKRLEESPIVIFCGLLYTDWRKVLPA